MPRKRYRPRPVGRPILRQIRTDLMLPMHLAVQRISKSPDREEQRQAWHDLMVLTETWRLACADRKDVVKVIDAGRVVLHSIWQRRDRSWLPTGEQLQVLRLVVSVCDDVLPYLRTDQIAAGLRDMARRVELV